MSNEVLKFEQVDVDELGSIIVELMVKQIRIDSELKNIIDVKELAYAILNQYAELRKKRSIK